ncbi:MAG TPA: 16S rRNA (guanine(966)-N(2))-methyltransferase RsmD, partial [Pseudomonas sp.]|nr:16S rRNA (guanine(966)-N(2))-methyltransferase RsmD [Pseudomonas sp.]
LPGNWRLHREKKAGKVFYALWERQAPSEPTATQ